eukprot:gene408-482_t
MSTMQKQTSSMTLIDAPNDLTKLKTSLAQRAMARRKRFETKAKRSQSVSGGSSSMFVVPKPKPDVPPLIIETPTTAPEPDTPVVDTNKSIRTPREDVFTRLSSMSKTGTRSRSLKIIPKILRSSKSTIKEPKETPTKEVRVKEPKETKVKEPKIKEPKPVKEVKEPKETKVKEPKIKEPKPIKEVKETKSKLKTEPSTKELLKQDQPKTAPAAAVPPKVSPTKNTTISTSTNTTTSSISLTSSTSKLSSFKCTTMTPSVALKLYVNDLTMAEQSEIFDYPQVYFTGNTTQKTKFNKNLPNNGYDDDNCDYRIVEHDHIGYRYEVLSILGQGSFCQVVKGYDHKTDQLVALKILRNQKRFRDQADIEIKILEYLKNNDPNSTANIVHLNDHFTFRNHLCITFELLSMNLYDFLKMNQFQGFNLSLIRRFAAQLLTSLRFLSKRHIIHADLKPENILLKQPTKSGIKLIDFGSSCFENEQIFTYIQSRFYRSPEVILGIQYDKAIDIWSLGCILAELYMGSPLFPGHNEPEILACVMELFGVPNPSIIQASTRKEVFFEDDGTPKSVADANGNLYGISTRTLSDAMNCQDAEFVDFVQQCLKWMPNERITPEQGLRHPWITELTNTITTPPPPTTSTVTPDS